jgi:hypothetical protein
MSFALFAIVLIYASDAANVVEHVLASPAAVPGSLEAELEFSCTASMSLLQVAMEREQRAAISTDRDVPIVHVMYATTMNSTGLGDVGLMSSMLSLSQSLGNPHRAVIHLVVPAVDMALAMGFRECFYKQFEPAQKHPTLEVHPLRPLPFDPGRNPHTTYLSGNSLTYARWLAPEYLPNVSKLFYLDTDTLVRVDIRPLYEMNQSTVMMLKPCGSICRNETLKVHYADFVVPADAEQLQVYSAGVMLADLDRWKAVNLTGVLVDQAKALLEAGSSLDDQLILNVVTQRMHILGNLPERFNTEGPGYFPEMFPDFSCTDAVWNGFLSNTYKSAGILHFSGKSKQWHPEFQGCDLVDQLMPRTQCSASLA